MKPTPRIFFIRTSPPGIQAGGSNWRNCLLQLFKYSELADGCRAPISSQPHASQLFLTSHQGMAQLTDLPKEQLKGAPRLSHVHSVGAGWSLAWPVDSRHISQCHKRMLQHSLGDHMAARHQENCSFLLSYSRWTHCLQLPLSCIYKRAKNHTIRQSQKALFPKTKPPSTQRSAARWEKTASQTTGSALVALASLQDVSYSQNQHNKRDRRSLSLLEDNTTRCRGRN